MNKICKVITLLLLAICLICHFIYLSYHMKILSDYNKKYLKEIKRQDEMIGYLNNEIKFIISRIQIKYISNHCRINDIELRTNKNNTNSKKAQIEELFKAGRSNTEIAKELKTNYNYVYKVTKNLL